MTNCKGFGCIGTFLPQIYNNFSLALRPSHLPFLFLTGTIWREHPTVSQTAEPVFTPRTSKYSRPIIKR